MYPPASSIELGLRKRQQSAVRNPVQGGTSWPRRHTRRTAGAESASSSLTDPQVCQLIQAGGEPSEPVDCTACGVCAPAPRNPSTEVRAASQRMIRGQAAPPLRDLPRRAGSDAFGNIRGAISRLDHEALELFSGNGVARSHKPYQTIRVWRHLQWIGIVWKETGSRSKGK